MELTHLDAEGRVQMVDVGGKADTERVAVAKGEVSMRPETLRLTADGQLRPCLLSDQEIDLRAPLRQGAGVAEIEGLLLRGIACKPMQHHLDEHRLPENRAMSEIGG